MKTNSFYNRIDPKGYSGLTYNNNRECLNCGNPLADQEHATRTFCKHYYDEFGKPHDCKSDYHSKKNKPAREIHSNIIRDHRFYSKQILEMIKKKGSEVITGDLNAYDIILTDAINIELKKDGRAICRFLDYTITSNPNTNHHTITSNEQ